MAVEIRSDVTCYPHFKDGQVLTHNDLNQLRDFLYSKSMFHGRALFGFGVGCGLEGVHSSGKLEFSSGFALAQRGLELVYPDAPASARTFDLGAITPSADSYPFLTGAAGMTAVLRPVETIEAAGGTCTAAGCTTHTDRHCQKAEIAWVKGQLSLTALEDHPALKLNPVVPRDTPSLDGYEALRVAVKGQLAGLVETQTIALLDTMKLTGPKGIDLLKVGLVNEILYTLWDYIACKRSLATSCFGETGEPAVALGYALKTGTTWAWDQRYRHYFRLSLALSRAIRNYRGQDMCERHLDHIRALIEDFTPPPIPSNQNDVHEVDPDFHICAGKSIYLGRCPEWHGKFRKPWDRYAWIDPSRRRQLRKIDLLWDPTPDEMLEGAEWVTHLTEVDPIAAGTITAYGLLGARAKGKNSVEEVLNAEIKATGVTPDVHVLTQEAFDADTTLQPTLMASITDTIYVGYNPAGAMTGMAIKSSAQAFGNMRNVTLEAGRALDKAGEAVGQAQQYEARIAETEHAIIRIDGDAATAGTRIEEVRNEALRKIRDVHAELPSGERLAKAVALADDFAGISGDVRELKTKVALQERVVRTAGGVVVGEKAVEANYALKGALVAIRTAVERSATTRQLRAVREAFDAIEPELQKIDEATESGVLMTAAQPEALATVLEGITQAVEAAGVERNTVEYTNLRNNVDALRSTMGVPRA